MEPTTRRPREFVLVVPRRELFKTHDPQGFLPFAGAPQSLADSVEDGIRATTFHSIVDEHSFFVERDHAERNPDLKQIIPYALVTGVDASGSRRVLCLKRTRKGGDPRLFDKLSIGVGGHVEPIDADGQERPVDACSERELNEEIVLPERVGPTRSLGLINDDSNPVGAVHVGLVQVVEVRNPETIAVRERDLLVGTLESPARLRAMRESGSDFESWSSLLLDSLEDWIAAPGAEIARVASG